MAQFAKVPMSLQVFNQAHSLIDCIKHTIWHCVTEIALQEICGASCIFATFSGNNIYLKLHVYPESWSLSRHYTSGPAKIKTFSSKDASYPDSIYTTLIEVSKWIKETN